MLNDRHKNNMDMKKLYNQAKAYLQIIKYVLNGTDFNVSFKDVRGFIAPKDNKLDDYIWSCTAIYWVYHKGTFLSSLCVEVPFCIEEVLNSTKKLLLNCLPFWFDRRDDQILAIGNIDKYLKGLKENEKEYQEMMNKLKEEDIC